MVLYHDLLFDFQASKHGFLCRLRCAMCSPCTGEQCEVRANDACNSCVMEVNSEGPSKNMMNCSAKCLIPEVSTWMSQKEWRRMGFLL